MTPEQLEAHRVRFEQAYSYRFNQSVQILKENRDDESYSSQVLAAAWEGYKFALADADRAQRAAPGVQGGDSLNCQSCDGSGEQEHWDRLGESGGYDVTGPCFVCGGSGIVPLRPAQPPQQSAQPVADEGEDAALSAAMQRGNSLGVKSSDALRIIAAYKVAQPAGLQTCNCRWNDEIRVQQCTLHQAWEDNQHDQADELRHFRAAQPVEVQRAASRLACRSDLPVHGAVIVDRDMREWVAQHELYLFFSVSHWHVVQGDKWMSAGYKTPEEALKACRESGELDGIKPTRSEGGA